jgi:4-hydroxymandelate oxidase
MAPINLDEYEAAARQALDQTAYDYYAGGADDEVTLDRNHSAYSRYDLHYRVLRNVTHRDLSTTVSGQEIALPVLIAPTAFQRLAHPQGELAMVRAAGRLGTVMILSTLATTSIEEVTAAASGPVWFQLYIYNDRPATAELVQRAQAAGCGALVLTVDAIVAGRRERDIRNGFHLPPGLEIKNLLADSKGQLPAQDGKSGLTTYINTLFDSSLGWQDVEWLAGLSDLPLWIKGIVHPEDARLAAEHGAAGVVVSNHGGRQLDTSPATIDVLATIVDAVGDGLEIIVDGGVRRGTDVVKALALGARAVAVGRPALWGLAVDGQAGVEHALGLLRNEFDTALGLCGCRAISELGRDLISRPACD